MSALSIAAKLSGAAVAALLSACLVSGIALAEGAARFSDVDDSAWYGGEDGCVAYVADSGAMTGYAGTDLFGPDDTLTRAQAVTAIFRMVAGDPDRLTSDPAAYSTVADESGFSDTEGGAYYTAALNWAVSEGVAQGHDGFFRPYDPVTREELVTLVGRAVDNGNFPGRMDTEFIRIADEESISEWAAPHVKWAYRYLIRGTRVSTENGRIAFIRPLDDATRAETAQILTRLDMSLLSFERADSNAG